MFNSTNTTIYYKIQSWNISPRNTRNTVSQSSRLCARTTLLDMRPSMVLGKEWQIFVKKASIQRVTPESYNVSAQITIKIYSTHELSDRVPTPLFHTSIFFPAHSRVCCFGCSTSRREPTIKNDWLVYYYTNPVNYQPAKRNELMDVGYLGKIN